MPDITLCLSTTCLCRKFCFRYLAYPSEYQSYFMVPPGSGISCKSRWDVNHTTAPIRDWRQVDQQLTEAAEEAA